jgi:hypothetical protein
VIDDKEIIYRLSVLSKKYHLVQRELSDKYHFDEWTDARINVFKHCYLVIDSTYLIFLARVTNFRDDAWWANLMHRHLINREMSKEQRDVFIKGFDHFVPSAYITMLFVAIENAFRTFYLSVFSKDPPSKFHVVYKKLLQEFNLEKYNDLLKIVSYLRNSFHNNGRHTLGNDDVTWEGITYHFEKGKNVVFKSVWQTFTDLTTSIHEMLERLVKSDTILRKKEIIDASYTAV